MHLKLPEKPNPWPTGRGFRDIWDGIARPVMHIPRRGCHRAIILEIEGGGLCGFLAYLHCKLASNQENPPYRHGSAPADHRAIPRIFAHVWKLFQYRRD